MAPSILHPPSIGTVFRANGLRAADQPATEVDITVEFQRKVGMSRGVVGWESRAAPFFFFFLGGGGKTQFFSVNFWVKILVLNFHSFQGLVWEAF